MQRGYRQTSTPLKVRLPTLQIGADLVPSWELAVWNKDKRCLQIARLSMDSISWLKGSKNVCLEHQS